MPPIRNVGPRVPSAVGSVDTPQAPQAPSQPAPAARTGSSPRSMFEDRPKVENLTRNDGTANTTWTQMTASLGEAYDLRKAGRAVDTNLLYELSRYERDPMPQRLAAAELAAMGAIDGKAMEQITNNGNFEGFRLPVEDRLAFALLMNNGQKPIAGYPMNTGKPVFETAAAVLHKPVGGAWVDEARAQARELLQAASNNTLLSSPAFAAVLRSQLPDGGAALPAALRESPRALLAFQAATAGGATLEQAKAYAQQAADGKLDVVTFRALSPSANFNGHVLFNEQFGKSALAPGLSLEEAAQVARRVAGGELDFGQLHGFMLRFGASDDWPRANFSVTTAAELVVAVNNGQLTEAGIARALDPAQYFPGNLTNKIWDHFFSGRDNTRGNHFTVDGAVPPSTWQAPMFSRLEPAVIQALAADDGKRAAFAQAFQAKVNEGLPRGLGVMWDRFNGNLAEPEQKYAALMEAAIAAGRTAAGI